MLVACLYARPVLPDARDPACVERDCGRAKLLLECRTWGEDGLSGRTAKKAPPRSSAPGKFDVVLAPARYMSSLLALAQPGQFVEFGTQSATHSARLPTMSKAPRAETQLLRAPVRDGEPSPEPDVLRAGVEMQVTLSCGAGGPQGPRGERGAREKALHGTKHAVLEEQAPVAAVWNHHHPPAWSACGGRGGHQGIVGAEDRELAVRQSSREGWRPESDQSANAAAVAYLEEVAGEDPSQAVPDYVELVRTRR